ncbi:CHASE2 domain-containing protein [Variovorax sp. ZT4R33]|uniref:CHASE2 domain-containing protein n=1 Tax=Variovorax sp. ZT4R33 TaxID=3443743 RepID=UPI003F47F878
MRRRFLIESLLTATLLPLLLLWANERPGLGDVNRMLYDQVMRADERAAPSPDIVIIGIDERSIAALGPWPWSRTMHAHLLEQLAPYAPRSVLFNVFFDTPGPPEDDVWLATAMAKLPVYLPMNFGAVPATTTRLAPETVGYGEPVPVLARAARGLGHVNANADSDDRVRTLFRYEGTAARLAPYVGVLIASGAQDATPARPSFEPEGRWTRLSRFGFRLAGPAGSYRTVSYIDVLLGTVPLESFRGKNLLIGAVEDSRLDDQLAVMGTGVRGAALPGVEVHANAMDVLMQGRAIEFPEMQTLWLWIAVPLWTAMVLFLVVARHAAVGALALGLATASLGIVALHEARMALPLGTPLASIAGAYVIWSWRRLAALMQFFRQRVDALNAVPAGAFEPVPAAEGPAIDSLEQRTRSLDRAIARLVALQSTLSDSLALMPVPVLICRGDGLIGQSNGAARALLTPSSWGRVPTDRPGDTLAGRQLFGLLAPLQRVDVVDALPSAALPSLWREAVSGEYTTPLGAVFRAQAVCLGQGGPGPESARWIVVLRDLTRERQGERERAALFSFFSHDLRAPQVSILSLLELNDAGDAAMASKDLNAAVAREAQRTLTMAESFMTMLEAESSDYRIVPVSIASVVMDALDAVWASAQKRGVTLRERLHDDETFVLADGALLMRALRNLLDNAIRHSAPGTEVHVCLAASPAQDGQSGVVLIAIRDEGEGMDSEGLSRVREAGHRRTGAGREHGWGLGLAVVNTVVARHGGWIDVTSKPGAGTQFMIGLPQCGPESPPPAAIEAGS